MGTCVVTAPPPMVFTCVTAALERQPVLFDPLKVPVAIQVCCTMVVTVAWLFNTLCESDVEVVNVVIVVYCVAVAAKVQDMVLAKESRKCNTKGHAKGRKKNQEKRVQKGPK